MKRLKSLVKSQQKVRAKRKQVLKELSIDHPEVATKLKKLEVKTTAGQPNLESQQEGLLEDLLDLLLMIVEDQRYTTLCVPLTT